MRPLCILHAGTEKTGSTTLQHFLQLNEAALAARKIWVPRALLGDAPHLPFNHVLLATASRLSIGEPDDMQRARGLDSLAAVETHRTQVAENLAAEWAGLDFVPERIIISSEHVHSRLRSAQDLWRAKALLAPYCRAFRVVLYLRRQDEMARSLAAMALRQGATECRPIPDFNTTHGYDEMLGVNHGYFDFDALLTRLSGVFSEAALSVRLYAPEGETSFDIGTDFFGHLAIDISAMPRPPRRNTSSSQTAAALLLYMNPRLKEHPQRGVIRNRMLSYLATYHPGRLDPAPAVEAEEFLARYAAGNEAVRRRWFPERETLFPPIAPDVPQLPRIPLSAEQADAMLIEILRHPQPETLL